MAAPENPPELSVVGEQESPSNDAAGSPPPSQAPAAQAPRWGRSSRHWLWPLLGLVGLALALQQYQRAESLASQVDSLTRSLAEAGRNLEAYRTRFQNVRASVNDLDHRMDALRVLVDADPLKPAAPLASSDASAPRPSDGE
ncbi:MAG: hypothetical protein VCC04_06495 [Myxococcota bacterium]